MTKQKIQANIERQGRFIEVTMSIGNMGPIHHIYRFDESQADIAKMVVLNINKALSPKASHKAFYAEPK